MSRTYLAICFTGLMLAGADGQAQVGGKTAADGIFMLDNFEDGDTTAGGVQRAWVGSGNGDALTSKVLSGSGLTLFAGQTPVYAADIRLKFQGDYMNDSAGVPVPSVPGASTLTSPGNMTSFSKLSFLTRVSDPITSQIFSVTLECYPGGPSIFPKLHWRYNLTPGTVFQKIEFDLRSPTAVTDAGALTVEQLLSQTRFLSFNYYGGPEPSVNSATVHLDDIRLEPPVISSVDDWALYY